MRRTLAVAGIAALGLTGLSGPASADAGAGVTVFEGVVIDEVAAELNPASTTMTGGFINLMNTTTGNVDIANWEVNACNTTIAFETLALQNNTQLGPSEEYLIADPDFSASGIQPDAVFPNLDEILERAGGGVQLINDGAGSEVQDEIRWGEPASVCDAFPDAQVEPTDALSINRPDDLNDPWDLASPTPAT